MSLNLDCYEAKQSSVKIRTFDKTKTHQLNQFMISKLQNFQKHIDANEACNELLQCYIDGIDKYSKTKRSSTRTTAVKPWVSPALLCSINKKNKLYKKLLKNPSDKNEKSYKQFRNTLTKIMREAKRMYYEKSFMDSKDDSKKTWKLLNEVINKRNTHNNELPASFIDNDGRCYEKDEVPMRFNEYFSSIGSRLEENIPSPSSSPLDFLTPPNYEEFQDELITYANEVRDIIRSLNPVGGGFDKISTELLHSTYLSIIHHLTFFFNLCLSTAVFPDQLKIAVIKPIYKAGERNMFNNYRPISLLPIFSKILEKIIHSQLSLYIDKHNIINPLQFGFRKNHSTYMPIAHMVDQITSSLQEKFITCVLYVDLKKAFDTVSKDILLKKLAFIGVRGKLHEILKSYLTNRKQKTQVNAHLSEETNVEMGVPQGSILGPLLFIIYINDISNISKQADFYLFADDTAIAVRARKMPELRNKLDSVLNMITEWFCVNRLSLNVSKTFYQIFSKQVIHDLDVRVNGIQIGRKTAVKYLGIKVDENLKWQNHINSVAAVISRNIGVMGRARYYISSRYLLLLYNILVLPYLNYCAAVWGANHSTRIDKLLKLQKRALRIIDKKPYSYHTKELFIKYKVQRFPDLVKKQQIMILLGYLNKSLPQPISEMFKYHTPVGTRAAQHFKMPYARTNYKTFALSITAPKAWNTIICKIFKDLADVPRNKYTLKKYVVEYFLDQYSNAP